MHYSVKLYASFQYCALNQTGLACAHCVPWALSNTVNVLVCGAGRVHMAVPVSGMTPARRERNGNKHKRLFMGGPGGLTVCCLTANLLSQCQIVALLPTC